MENQTLIIGLVLFVLFFYSRKFFKQTILIIVCAAYLFYGAVNGERNHHMYLTLFLSLIAISQLLLKTKDCLKLV